MRASIGFSLVDHLKSIQHQRGQHQRQHQHQRLPLKTCGEESPKLSTRQMMAALRKAAATGGGKNDEGDGGGGGDDGGGGGDGAHEVKLAAVERQSKEGRGTHGVIVPSPVVNPEGSKRRVVNPSVLSAAPGGILDCGARPPIR